MIPRTEHGRDKARDEKPNRPSLGKSRQRIRGIASDFRWGTYLAVMGPLVSSLAPVKIVFPLKKTLVTVAPENIARGK